MPKLNLESMYSCLVKHLDSIHAKHLMMFPVCCRNAFKPFSSSSIYKQTETFLQVIRKNCQFYIYWTNKIRSSLDANKVVFVSLFQTKNENLASWKQIVFSSLQDIPLKLVILSLPMGMRGLRVFGCKSRRVPINKDDEDFGPEIN